MNDLFLSLKYKGVKTPWEISINPSQYGWSCRKWIRHQTNPKDKANLKKFADSLIDSNIIQTDCLPTVNRIAEHVQRWRKDSEQYTLEPDQREEYKELRRLIDVARSTPAIINSILNQEFLVIDADKQDSERLPSLLKETSVVRFISKLSKKIFTGNQTSKNISVRAWELITDLFRLYGVSPGMENIDELIDYLLLEIDINPEIMSPGKMNENPNVKEHNIFIERYSGSKTVLCCCEYRQGKVYVSANCEHAWINKTGLTNEPTDSTYQLLHAIGEAYLSHLGDRESIESFLAEIGVNLSRRVC